ncbi:MAG: hypothetical protein PHO53_01075 [Actinomycetota bacterium]|nr:hypothetical protein [Actinomycetota bacterium]
MEIGKEINQAEIREIPEEVFEAVKENAQDGRITCARANCIAAELGVVPSVVGKAIDALGIKITNCQLGCF